MDWIKCIGVWLCYFGWHDYRWEKFDIGGVALCGRRCTRCKYEPMWER